MSPEFLPAAAGSVTRPFSLSETALSGPDTARLARDLAAAESAGDRQEFIASANDLACQYRSSGDYDTAAYFQLLAATAERQTVAGLPGRLSPTSLGNLACDALLAGQLAIAEGLLWKSLLAELAAGNEPGIAADWGNLGLLAGLSGDLPAARQRLWWAIKIHRRQGDLFHLAFDLWHLGQLWELDANWDIAQRLFARAADLFASVGHVQFQSEAARRSDLNAARAAVLAFDVRRN